MNVLGRDYIERDLIQVVAVLFGAIRTQPTHHDLFHAFPYQIRAGLVAYGHGDASLHALMQQELATARLLVAVVHYGRYVLAARAQLADLEPHDEVVLSHNRRVTVKF